MPAWTASPGLTGRGALSPLTIERSRSACAADDHGIDRHALTGRDREAVAGADFLHRHDSRAIRPRASTHARRAAKAGRAR